MVVEWRTLHPHLTYRTTPTVVGFVTWCYKSGGASDPNGFDYNGYGFTGTLLQHGKQVPLGSIRAGDLVFYGHPVSTLRLQ